MADFTTIPDSNIEPGKPIRSIDGLALRDNPIAIAEGAAGAPKIAGQQGPAVETGGIANSAVTTAKIAANERMTNANVRTATASSSAGAVGTYGFFIKSTFVGQSDYTAGNTQAGSGLRYSSTNRNSGGTPSGTWRAMGTNNDRNNSHASVWLRIS